MLSDPPLGAAPDPAHFQVIRQQIEALPPETRRSLADICDAIADHAHAQSVAARVANDLPMFIYWTAIKTGATYLAQLLDPATPRGI